MVTLSPYPAARPARPARPRAADGLLRLRDAVTAVTLAALCASSAPELDEAGVLRTAVAQQRRCRAGPRPG